jgi:hypothetical protein
MKKDFDRLSFAGYHRILTVYIEVIHRPQL